MFKQIIIVGFILFSLNLNAKEINLNNTIKEASLHNKKLFLFIHTTDCGYCESMLEFTLDDDNIKTKLKNNFVYEHINVKKNDIVIFQDFKGSSLEFAKAIGYDLYPSSLFFDKNRNLILAIPGYQDEKRFNHILNFIISKSYLKMNFHQYEKESK